jgi:hypothetical protein
MKFDLKSIQQCEILPTKTTKLIFPGLMVEFQSQKETDDSVATFCELHVVSSMN